MVQISFVAPGGRVTAVEARPGRTVMDAAVQNDVPGILGECGGSCACATCHVYVDEAWRAAAGMPSASEDSMLSYAAAERRPNSRLGCQIVVTPALAGLVVHVPQDQ